MSVILEFIEIERKPDCIVSENKTCGIFEVNNDQVKTLDSFLPKTQSFFINYLRTHILSGKGKFTIYHG
jgi:hypothetical protein